jgi:hypothetical protein
MRTCQGLGFYALCRNSDESIKHILMDGQSIKEVWDAVKSLTEGKGIWEGLTLAEGLKRWLEDPMVAGHKALPCIASWAI